MLQCLYALTTGLTSVENLMLFNNGSIPNNSLSPTLSPKKSRIGTPFSCCIAKALGELSIIMILLKSGQICVISLT